MKIMQWVCVVACALLVGWMHDRTDEIPVVLGSILILSSILGGVFPRKPWLTGIVMGAPPFIVETMVHFGLIHAPYPASSGIPWVGLIALIPALGGAFFGSAVRHLNRQENHVG